MKSYLHLLASVAFVLSQIHEAHCIPLDHVLTIRDAPSHVPLQSVRVRGSVLLSHIRKLNPNLKPMLTEVRNEVEFNQYSFNFSDWNAGLADYISHPNVKQTFKIEDIKKNMQNPQATEDLTDVKGNTKRSFTGFEKRAPESWPVIPPSDHDRDPPKAPIRGDVDPLVGEWKDDIKIVPRFDCFDKGVYAKLVDLQHISENFCWLFDQHMYTFARGIAVRDLQEFSLGTIWEAVLKPTKMRVNFQFTYAPYTYTKEKRWYPMSMFSGIQGFCFKFLINYLHPESSPCKGGAKEPDTRGGWVGFNAGGKDGDQWFVRWSVDPYTPNDDEEKEPYPYPGWELGNGLPFTRPKEIV